MELMPTPHNDDLYQEFAIYAFDSVFDKMVLSRDTPKLLSAFLEYPLGQWVDLQNFFTKQGVRYPNTKVRVFACWLHELESVHSPYRILVFHEYGFMQSRLATINLNTLIA